MFKFRRNEKVLWRNRKAWKGGKKGGRFREQKGKPDLPHPLMLEVGVRGAGG